MEMLDYVKQRKEVQFSSELAFGKIAAYKTGSITVGASSNDTLTISHGLTSGVPLIVGWVKMANVADTWVPFWATENYAFTVSSGYWSSSIHTIASADATNIIFRIRNNHGGSNSFSFKVWCYYV